jgi:hypothetical protein
MTRSKDGIVPGWKITALIDDGSLTTLTLINWFGQQTVGSDFYVYGIDTAGRLYRSLNGSGTWSLLYTPARTSYGNGLIGGQDGEVYFTNDQYFGRYSPSAANYTTGTIAVMGGSPNVVGAGTTFTGSMVGRQIEIAGVRYFIATFTDATHIALDSNYAGSTASGLSFTIYSPFQEKYKFLNPGALSISTPGAYRPLELYEDWVVIGDVTKVALYNVTDASFNDTGLSLPANFYVRAIKSGRNGLLVGANVGNRSYLILWTPEATRSIAPWIPLNDNIKAIIPYKGVWLVITQRKIYISEGYTADVFVDKFPDGKINQATFTANLIPGGADIIEDKLVFFGTTDGLNRQKSGLYILDLNTKLFEFAPVANGCLLGITGGAVFFDSNYKTHLSYQTTTPAKKVIGHLSNTAPASSQVIIEAGRGNSNKVAEGVKLAMNLDPKETDRRPITFDATVKVANYKQLIWGYALTNGASSTAITIKVDGTATGNSNAEVGDEITILEGINAGLIRHIASIANEGTNTETWTLDTALPSNTENAIRISVSPFKLAKKSTLSGAAKMRDLYFPVTKQLQGKKYLIKILFDNVSASVPELTQTDFISNDLGQL